MRWMTARHVVGLSVTASVSFVALAGCTEKTSYQGFTNANSSNKKKGASTEDISKKGTGALGSEGVAITFSGDTEIQSAASDAEAWVVTDDEVTRIKLDESKNWPQTKWQIVDESGKPSSARGHRTYVSELGLLIGRTGSSGGVWLASDKNSGKAIPIFRTKDQGGGSRLSVTSFKIGDRPFIGFAYGTSGGKKKFVRIPIDKSKTNGIDVSKLEEVTLSDLSTGFGDFNAVGGVAAYGSFMDQKNKAFYLGANRGGMWGVNVEKMTELPSSALPNVAAEGRDLCSYKLSTRGKIAYALSGDLFGNIVTSQMAYTFAHDPVNNVIVGGKGTSLVVAKQECVTANGPKCTTGSAYCVEVDPAKAGAISPMSAVGDGRIVGIVRGQTSQVFILKVVNKDDLSKGVEVKKIADIPGDAYMYNDFTGLTLYAPDQVRVINFKKLKGFQAGKPVKRISAGWKSATGKTEDLRGLKIQLVCYKEGGSKGAYVDYTSKLTSSDKQFDLDVKDCNGNVDMLEVKVSSDGSTNNFSRLSRFEMKGAQ